MSKFYLYFKENMDGLNLPAPESLYGSLQAALANASLLIAAVEKFGPRVTVLELAGAGTAIEILGVATTLSGAYYAGAVVGSIAVAAGRTLGNDLSLSDVLIVITKHKLNRSWLRLELRRRPGICDASVVRRKSYRLAACKR